mgnify:CR=1 FL=1
MKNKKILFICVIILCVFSGCTDIIKTEYGDNFKAHYGILFDSYSIENYEHDFLITLSYYSSKDDLICICDTMYFRCYKFQNQEEDLYICGLKSNNKYLYIETNKTKAPPFFKEKYSEDFKKVFLADKYIMEVTMNYMDDVYHKEMLEMAQKLTTGDYEGLEQYGLTAEMIEDKESLEEKRAIMEGYLKEQALNKR